MSGVFAAFGREVRKRSKAEGIVIGTEIGKEQGIALGKEQGIALGKEQGIALGKEQGIVLGKEQGIALGKAQGIEQSKRAFVRSMLADGFAPEIIAKHSALSLAEVQALAQQQEKTEKPS